MNTGTRLITIAERVGVRYSLSLKIILFSLVLSAQTLTVAHAGGSSDGEARQWLQRMSQAVRSLNYEGTFVYRRGDKMVGMHITHVVDGRGARERLVTLNGVRREVIRDHDGVTCILPDKHLVVASKGAIDKPFPAKLLENPESIDAHYDLITAGQNRAMGRHAHVIVIKPHDKYRYGYRMWIDDKTGLLLESDVINKDGRVVEQMMFTSLKLLDKAPPSMDHQIHAIVNTVLKSTKSVSVAADPRWLVKQIPQGFRLIERRKRTRQSSGHAASLDHLVFTDGLASVSVFIENQTSGRPHRASPLIGISHLGAVNAYRTVVGNHQVTVVGEVPSRTVRLIGESVSYRMQRK